MLQWRGLLLSSNYTLGIKNPKDPGVVAYFTHEGVPLAIPCDRWDSIEDNVQAIALTIGAMRGINRWGAKHMIKAMFTGFKALPSTCAAQKPWWDVLGVDREASVPSILDAWKRRARSAHPDWGGSTQLMQEVNAAKESALAERGVK